MSGIDRPPQPYAGECKRRVGVEIEYGNLDCARAADHVRRVFSGKVVEATENSWRVEAPRLGTFEIKLDWRFAQFADGTTRDEAARGDLASMAKIEAARLLGKAGSVLMPYEVAAPPIPFDRLDVFDPLLAALRADGASDTSEWLHACALQLNPEVPSSATARILQMIRAYILMSEKLRAEIRINPARRISSFVERFPRSYRHAVLAPDYHPTRDRLIDDYLSHNPTRNRELDLLPLFAHLDEARVRKALDDPRIKPRPAYHYRLPDCRLTDPAWNVVTEWNRWVRVERLAADRPRLEELASAYRAHKSLSQWRRDGMALLP